MPAAIQLQADPQRTQAYLHYIYGLLHEYRGEFESATESFRKVKKHDPESALARIHLGVSLVHAGKAAEASREFDEATEIRSNNPQVRMLTGFPKPIRRCH